MDLFTKIFIVHSDLNVFQSQMTRDKRKFEGSAIRQAKSFRMYIVRRTEKVTFLGQIHLTFGVNI